MLRDARREACAERTEARHLLLLLHALLLMQGRGRLLRLLRALRRVASGSGVLGTRVHPTARRWHRHARARVAALQQLLLLLEIHRRRGNLQMQPHHS